MFNSEFLLTSLIIVLIPGTGVIYTVSTGLFQGAKASLLAALGCTAGIIPHLLVSTLGLSFILHMSATVFQGIKVLGVLYLFYLAWGLWRDKSEFKIEEQGVQVKPLQIIVRGILLNLLNPKLSIFFFAFLPLFVTQDGSSVVLEMFFLSLVFMLITLIVFCLYGVLASSVRSYVVDSPRRMRWIKRVFAIAFVGLGARLLVTEQ